MGVKSASSLRAHCSVMHGKKQVHYTNRVQYEVCVIALESTYIDKSINVVVN